MAIATPQLTALGKANLEAAQEWAMLMLEAAERGFNLNLQTARELCATGSQQLLDLWSVDTPRPPTYWPKQLEKNLERAAEFVRACSQSATRYQSESARLIQQQIPAINRTFAESMQQITGLAPALGADLAGRRGTEHEAKPRKAA